MELVDYIRFELIKASKTIDDILCGSESNSPLTDEDKSILLEQKGKILLLSDMIHDFKLYDQIDEEGILCGQY